MKRWRTCFVLSALLSTLAFGGPAGSQDHQAPVHDLTEGELTEEKLIEALRPDGDPPLEFGTARGIGLATRPRAKCIVREKANSRGIAVRPKAPVNVAAIQIYFAFNSAEILPAEHKNLQKVGQALKSDSLALCCFQVVGHTDDVGSDAYNERLSRMRAAAVARYLIEHFGVEPARLDSVGYGERKPMVSNLSEAGRSKNRRVEIANLGYGEPEV